MRRACLEMLSVGGGRQIGGNAIASRGRDNPNRWCWCCGLMGSRAVKFCAAESLARLIFSRASI